MSNSWRARYACYTKLMKTFLLAAAVCGMAAAQAIPLADPAKVKLEYDRLLPEIAKMPIFDDHGHPGYADDPDVDAMALPPGESAALRTRDDNPELIEAAKALFGFPYDDLNPEHAAWLAAKKKMLRTAGPEYFDGILDKLGVKEAAANRVAMPGYLDPKRFRWVPFVDSFLFPFDNSAMRARNPDEEVYIPMQEKKLKREMEAAGMTALPSTLEQYMDFVRKTVEQEKAKGAIAIKFEAAYFRSLRFGDPALAEAQRVYDKYRFGGVPSEREYTVFQDYVFRRLIETAGRSKMAVHIHTAAGIGDYSSLAWGNVLNLENVLRDPRYEATKFVLLHGGYPYEKEAIWLAARKNVYVDSSLMQLLLYPGAFSRALEQWLEVFPEKIVFGSDCFPFNEALGAEESDWLAVESAREALAAALARMVVRREVSEARALEMAKAYLWGTAVTLYGE
jgi:predicted TIM-barrel fold metal-dependent hydrolase